MVLRRVRRGLVAEVEDRALPREAVGLLPLPPRERVLDDLEHPATRRVGGVERAALHERLERALVRALRIDALREIPDRRELTALVARPDDRARGRVADVLHRVQPEADLPLDDG